MARREIDGVALAAVAAGATFIYAGLTGNSILATLRSWVQGKAPTGPAIHGGVADAAAAAEKAAENAIKNGAPGADPGNGPSGLGPSSGSAGGLGQSIATDAQKYDGTGYTFGGAPGDPNHPAHDCSSLVNQVIGWDLGLAIPFYAAGTYKGLDHGPDTRAWLLWTGCTTIGSNPAAALPGDLCCWQTHIGIAVGGGKMISARSATDNPPTGFDDIATGGPGGELLFIRRLNAAMGG